MNEYGGSSNTAFDSLLVKSPVQDSVVAIEDSDDFVENSQETNHSEDVVKNSQEKLEALTLKGSGDETKKGKKPNRFFVSKNVTPVKEFLPGGRVVNHTANIKEENDEDFVIKGTGKKRKLYAVDEEAFPCPWCGQSFSKSEIDVSINIILGFNLFRQR